MADMTNYGSARGYQSEVAYELCENIEFDVRPTFNLWRDNYIIHFDSAETDSIKVSYAKGKYALINDGENWTYRDDKETFKIDVSNRALARAINQLANLRTASFIDDNYAEYETSFKKPILEIDIYYKNGKTDNLAYIPQGNNYIIKVNGEENTLYVGVHDMFSRFTLSARHFKEVFQYSL
jgi:hypothetical protein